MGPLMKNSTVLFPLGTVITPDECAVVAGLVRYWLQRG